jgi:outer membrane receptor protein involved in Fe transport
MNGAALLKRPDMPCDINPNAGVRTGALQIGILGSTIMSSNSAAMRRLFFGGAALSALTIAIGSATAQTPTQAPAPEATEGGDVVVITGSLIPRTAETAPTPVIQVEQEDILISGEQNIVDFLADIPALQNSQVYEDTTGGFVGIGGLAFLNLRNLGSARTLVLVDGRRHIAGDPAGARVDVDTIPTDLVERVEIVTGGASALYGADAVSGVVNFIMKDDYEGLNLDLAMGQLTEGKDLFNKRVSLMAGTNLLEDRLNLYGFAEYQTSDVVNDRDLELDYIQHEQRVITVDADPASALSDGVFDAMAVSHLRTLNRPRGGILMFANGTRPSPAGDPDIPVGACTALNAASTAFQANCFASNPGTSYQFFADGTPFLADFGSSRNAGAVNRVTTVGGSGDSLVAVDTNRLPEQEAYRFQVGANFDLTDSIRLYAEAKYIDETNIDVFQPHFANIGIRSFAGAGATGTTGSNPFGAQSANFDYTSALAYTGITTFTIGLDNAYLPTSLRNAIIANQRESINSNGSIDALTVNDQRAQFRLFSYDLGFRPSVAERTTERYVIGAKGGIDQFAFVDSINWDIGYTYGKMEAVGTEPDTIDVERYAYSADAVVDTNGVVGPAGQIVCRVRILAAQGRAIVNPNTGATYAATDPRITGCVPSRIFGTGGFSQASIDYITTELVTQEMNEQHDVRGIVTGNLWDFWGAGPIGVALGSEYRKEITSADLTDFGDRTLFGNSGGDLPETSFDVTEFFAEVNIPLVDGVFLIDSLELSGAARTSNYSSVGVTDTWSVAGFWRVNDEIAFRGTKGISIRAPSMGELFSPPFDTFPNLTDGCSQPVINATASATIRDNRIRNCALLGIPTTYVDPAPTFSNQGLSGSNPLLKPEESDSWTASAIFTPSIVPGLAVVLDWYDIEITNAISTLSAQALLNLCTDSDVFNAQACGVFTRAPAGSSNEFEVINFIEGPFNFAALRSKGMDFDIKYGFETSDVFGSDMGRIDLSVVGNYLVKRQDFTNPTTTYIPTEIDTTVNNPRVRLRTAASWSQGPLTLTWRMDFQESQEIVNAATIGLNVDTRPSNLFTTGDFYQHDFAVRYDLRDNIVLRAGVNNVFDAEPQVQNAGLSPSADNFDLFGRRFFASANIDF